MPQGATPADQTEVKAESQTGDRLILTNPYETFSPNKTDLTPFSAAEAVSAATQILQNPMGQQKARGIDIKKVQNQLTEGLPGIEVEFLNTDSFEKFNGRLANEKELTAMMESFRDESRIPFGYIKDGCYARAHMMDESFRQHGINYAKMFVRGDLAAKNKYMDAHWWYHVAPLVFVDDGSGHASAKIIDPGFSDKPLDPEAWVKAMNQGDSIEVDLVGPNQYYPREYSQPDSFSESLPPAVSRMQSYARRLHGLQEDRGQHVGDFVTPTWDQPGSGGDFVVDGVRKTVFPEGVKSKEDQTLVNSNTGTHGTLVEFEPINFEVEISAAWEHRPAGFNPSRK